MFKKIAKLVSSGCLYSLLFLQMSLAATHAELRLFMDDDSVKRTSRNEKTEGIQATLEMEGQPKVGITLATRGQSSIKAPRKNYDFEINLCKLDDPKTHFHLWKKGSCAMSLINMWEDAAYISTLIGFEFMKATDVFDLNIMYVELFLNGKSRGLYLLSETPRQVIKERFHANWIALRKGAINGDKDLETFTKDMEHFDDASQLDISWDDPSNSCKDCAKRYGQINEFLVQHLQPKPKLKGEDLYKKIKKIIDLDQMFMFMAVNRLLRNGDFADEFMIYHTEGKKPLRIFGWDYDDLFKGIHWASKNSLKTKYDDSLVYNYETALFVLTAKDPFLRQKYHSKVKDLTHLATDTFIDQIVERVKTAITPFLDTPSVFENSALDHSSANQGKAYTKEHILKTLEERRGQMKQERDHMIQLQKKD